MSAQIGRFAFTNRAILFSTGLPKAVNINNNRCWKGAIIPVKGAKLSSDDVMYTSLPLYHAAAALIAVGSVVEAGR